MDSDREEERRVLTGERAFMIFFEFSTLCSRSRCNVGRVTLYVSRCDQSMFQTPL